MVQSLYIIGGNAMINERKLEKGKYRIIKISKEALWEFIYESIIDKQGIFFDISDETVITSHHDIDFESGNYICLVKNNIDSEQIDLQALLNNMEDTTQSLYEPNRYREFSIDELVTLQLGK